MTATTDFDRLVADWLETAGPSDIRAEIVNGALATASRVSQRRGLWAAALSSEAWPRRDGSIGSVTRRTTWRVLLVLAALALIGGLVAFIAGHRTPPSDVRNGPLMIWVPDGSGGTVHVLAVPPSDVRNGPLMIWVPDGSGGTVHVLAPDGKPSVTLTLPSVRHCPRLLPDGLHVVYWTGESILMTRSLAGDLATVALDPAQIRGVGGEVWDRSGWRVALRGRVLDLRDRAVSAVPEVENVVGRAWDASNNLTVAVQTSPEEVAIVQVAEPPSSRRELARIKWKDTEGAAMFSWSPDGVHLAAAQSGYSEVLILNIRTGDRTTIVTENPFVYVSDAIWSPAGDQVALIGKDGSLVVTAVSGAGRVAIPAVGAGFTGPVSWSLDGRWLAALTSGGDLVTVRPDGSELVDRHLGAALAHFAWAPDSTSVAVWERGLGGDTVAAFYPPERDVPASLIALENGSEGWSCITWYPATPEVVR